MIDNSEVIHASNSQNAVPLLKLKKSSFKQSITQPYISRLANTGMQARTQDFSKGGVLTFINRAENFATTPTSRWISGGGGGG